MISRGAKRSGFSEDEEEFDLDVYLANVKTTTKNAHNQCINEEEDDFDLDSYLESYKSNRE